MQAVALRRGFIVQRFKKDRIGLKEAERGKCWHNPKQTGRYVHDVWNKERSQ
jgi:hypothetical protein